MTTAHTPTPWKYDGSDGIYIEGITGGKYYVVGGIQDKDAAFIVLAVNSHDALVKALDDTLEFLERNSGRWDGINGRHPNAVAEDARAALRLARSGEA